MSQENVLDLSIGDVVADRRTHRGFSGDIELQGRRISVVMTPNAVRAAEQARTPVVAQMELYFSCLVRKQVRFVERTGVADGITPVRVLPGFDLAFRAVCTQHCSIAEAGDVAPVETMPVTHPDRFVPDWVRVDHRSGRWCGEYGFARQRNKSP